MTPLATTDAPPGPPQPAETPLSARETAETGGRRPAPPIVLDEAVTARMHEIAGDPSTGDRIAEILGIGAVVMRRSATRYSPRRTGGLRADSPATAVSA